MNYPVVICVSYLGEPMRVSVATNDEELKSTLEGIKADDSMAQSYAIYEHAQTQKRVTRWEVEK